MAPIKVPPHNEEAEQSVLGAILINKESISLVSEKLTPRDFYDDNHGKIFESMMALFEEGKPIDILTLTKALKKKKADKVDPSYLTDLLNVVPDPAAPAWAPPVAPEPTQGGEQPAADPVVPAWTPPAPAAPEPSTAVETPAAEPETPAAGGTDQGVSSI